MAQTIMAGWSKDSFELALERHIRDKDEQDRMAKDKANAPSEVRSQGSAEV